VCQMNGQKPPSQGQGGSAGSGGNQPVVFPSSWAAVRASAGAPAAVPSADPFARLPPLSSLQPGVTTAAAAAAAVATAAASPQDGQPPPTPAAATAAASGRSNGAAPGVGGGRVAQGQVEVIEVCFLRLVCVLVCAGDVSDVVYCLAVFLRGPASSHLGKLKYRSTLVD